MICRCRRTDVTLQPNREGPRIFGEDRIKTEVRTANVACGRDIGHAAYGKDVSHVFQPESFTYRVLLRLLSVVLLCIVMNFVVIESCGVR